ncbi:MAG: tetratricopeptide repeat protein [Crocinitomicaceae bacterium]
MRITSKIIITFIVCLVISFAGFTQNNIDFEDFKKLVIDSPNDSLTDLFYDRIIELRTKQANNSEIFKTLELQIEVGDTAGNKMLKNNGITQIIEFSDRLAPEQLFDYLSKAGNHQVKLGNIDKGIEFQFKAINLAEELKNDSMLAKVFLRLGINFMRSNNLTLSEKYLKSAIEIYEKMSDEIGLSSAYMSYGNFFKNSKIYDSALYYYDKSLAIAMQQNYARNKAGNYNNIANVFRLQKHFEKAISFYLKAVEINIETDNLQWLSYNYNNLGVTYNTLKNSKKALEYYKKSLDIKDKMGDIESKISTLENISEVYAGQGNYKKAFEFLNNAELIREDYGSATKAQLTARLEAKFQSEKKESELKQIRAEQDLQSLTLETQSKQFALQEVLRKERRYLLIVMVVIIASLFLAVILFWRNTQQRKKYVDTLHQKNNQIRTVNSNLQNAQSILTRKNDEITDSITYAKRIQAAILPSQKVLKTVFDKAFVMYLPKDIVAGDFYWTEQVGDVVLFAVADCTGHGVPGAMVSVICNNALNASIKNDKLIDPGKILDNTTDIVLSQFSKSEEDVKDGMDIALCAYNKVNGTLKYAGANIPLWLVRNGSVQEIKATRQPIGKHVVRQAFLTHELAIQENDTIYLSSDGFADQFGGLKNKKYMKKNFKDLLANVSEKTINEQNNEINSVFVNWKQENDQVDDICVMGIQFSI